MIDYSKFENSLKHLQLQYDNYSKSENRAGLQTLDREAIAESVIQRFETCYDSLWKVLKRYLAEEAGIADLPNSPKPLFRVAAESRILPGRIEGWLEYAGARVDTTHDYSGHKAEAALELMPRFIDDAVNLYIFMTGKPWK